jgi:Sugar transferases involved in lipopolysaccharide synthesis
MIIFLSPLLLFVSLINLLSGENKILFFQERVIKNNKTFKIIKFATMIENSIKMGSGGFVEKNDWRLLPFGGFLRKTKINELPQII